MRISVKVKPGAKQDTVKVLEDGSLHVSVKAPPVDGKANDAVADALARHFGVKRNQVSLRSGASSRTKVFDIGT